MRIKDMKEGKLYTYKKIYVEKRKISKVFSDIPKKYMKTGCSEDVLVMIDVTAEKCFCTYVLLSDGTDEKLSVGKRGRYLQRNGIKLSVGKLGRYLQRKGIKEIYELPSSSEEIINVNENEASSVPLEKYKEIENVSLEDIYFRENLKKLDEIGATRVPCTLLNFDSLGKVEIQPVVFHSMRWTSGLENLIERNYPYIGRVLNVEYNIWYSEDRLQKISENTYIMFGKKEFSRKDKKILEENFKKCYNVSFELRGIEAHLTDMLTVGSQESRLSDKLSKWVDTVADEICVSKDFSVYTGELNQVENNFNGQYSCSFGKLTIKNLSLDEVTTGKEIIVKKVREKLIMDLEQLYSELGVFLDKADEERDE